LSLHDALPISSSPSPWKSYGDVRGLNAPPLMNFSPLLAKSCATVSTCSCDSTEHGPNTNCFLLLPTIAPLSNCTIVSSGFNLRETYKCFSFSDFCKSVEALNISLNNCLIVLSL